MQEAQQLLASTLSQNNKNIAIWAGFLTVSLIIYFLFSSGDFSFLLTYASFLRCFGFALLNYKMLTGKTARGVSVKSLELYVVVFVCRLLSILRHQGYLPFDKSGDWFYHLVEIISLVSVFFAIYLLFIPLLPTYDEKYDKFGNLHVPDRLGALYLLGPTILLAIFFHPSLNNEMFSDVCWTASMYLESVALFPQLYMFQKQATDEGGIVENLTSHMVFALGFSRVFEFAFWMTSFSELQHHSGSVIAGYLVLLAQVGHIGIMADFFYYYFKSVTVGAPMELPTNYAGIV